MKESIKVWKTPGSHFDHLFSYQSRIVIYKTIYIQTNHNLHKTGEIRIINELAIQDYGNILSLSLIAVSVKYTFVYISLDEKSLYCV